MAPPAKRAMNTAASSTVTGPSAARSRWTTQRCSWRASPGAPSARSRRRASRGSLAFDFEDMNVLHYFDATEGSRLGGFRRIVVTEPEHPYIAAWWPAGHVLGYEHAFTHQVVDLIGALVAGEQPTPSFADGLAVQRVLDAVERSAAADSTWTLVATD